MAHGNIEVRCNARMSYDGQVGCRVCSQMRGSSGIATWLCLPTVIVGDVNVKLSNNTVPGPEIGLAPALSLGICRSY